jgi:hypothetical protein
VGVDKGTHTNLYPIPARNPPPNVSLIVDLRLDGALVSEETNHDSDIRVDSDVRRIRRLRLRPPLRLQLMRVRSCRYKNQTTVSAMIVERPSTRLTGCRQRRT